MKISEYIIDFLSKRGIDTVFTVSGGGCIFLIDALRKHPSIKTIATHHEQAAVIAAEGYARLKNDIGACVVTSGPGGTNALTGVLCAWQDSVPMIIISGQVNKDLTIDYTGLTNLRQLGDQEFDIINVVKHITKYSAQINDARYINYHLTKAFVSALSGRPGPVWLDIPLDIQNSDVPVDLFSVENGFLTECNTLPIVSDNQIREIINKLKTSKKPLLIVGNGIRLAHGENSLNDFLQKTHIPVITSVNGNDLVTNNYKYYYGRFGIIAQVCANKLIQECDLLISIGSRLYIRQIGYSFDTFAKNAYKIYSDIDWNELNKPTLRPDMIVQSDAKYLLNVLTNRIDILPNYSDWYKLCNELKSPHMLPKHKNQKPLMSCYQFMDVLNDFMREDLHVICSDGCSNVITTQVLQNKPNQRIIINKGCAPMGYGLPAAIGAHYVNKTPVICLEGDGSIHMNIHELQTVFHHQIPLKIFIINNDGYLSIKITQNSLFNGNKMISNPQSGLTLPSYEKIAWAYGIPYKSITEECKLHETINEVINHSGPIICEVFTNPLDVFEPKVNIQGFDETGKMIPGEIGNIEWVK